MYMEQLLNDTVAARESISSGDRTPTLVSKVRNQIAIGRKDKRLDATDRRSMQLKVRQSLLPVMDYVINDGFGGHYERVKPLYVALAQRKEDRKAHLASQYMQRVTGMRLQQMGQVINLNHL